MPKLGFLKIAALFSINIVITSTTNHPRPTPRRRSLEVNKYIDIYSDFDVERCAQYLYFRKLFLTFRPTRASQSWTWCSPGHSDKLQMWTSARSASSSSWWAARHIYISIYLYLQVTEYSSGGKRTSVSSSEEISADQVLPHSIVTWNKNAQNNESLKTKDNLLLSDSFMISC